MEVFLPANQRPIPIACLLHVRGGVSIACKHGTMEMWSSPRPWRCFLLEQSQQAQSSVFSTSVEVFLSLPDSDLKLPSLLHVRGGVSMKCVRPMPVYASSPRPWRCFSRPVTPAATLVVFSTSVEVFPNTCVILGWGAKFGPEGSSIIGSPSGNPE